MNEKTFLDTQKRRIQKYHNYRIRMPLSILDRFFLTLYLKNSKKNQKKILFEGSIYSSLVLAAKKYYQVRLMVQGKSDRLFALKHFIGCLGMNDLEPLAFYYVKERNIRYLYELVEKMEDKLKMIAPDYIVLQMDMFPLERAMVLAAKKLGIPTLVIQHGKCSSQSCSLDFKVADYVLVWGEYFKDLCIEKCMRKPLDVYVLGYSYVIGNNAEINNKRRRVCYLGEDFERHDKDFLPINMETIYQLSKICEELGLDFIYRPHPPRDDKKIKIEDKKIIADYLPGVLLTPQKETLDQTFKKADILVSFSSTALVEGAMRSKISLQLMNFPIETENLEMLGACSKSFQTIEELRAYLAEIASAPNLDKFKTKFNNNYIETRYNLYSRFLEIIEEIEKQKKWQK
ncbi:MAG: hypothetical protein ABSF55_02490 [Candidatus Staskawiczbacteria bacterium]